MTVPGKPLQFISGGDGGVVRSDGKLTDISGKCDTRGVSAADNVLCKSLLNRVLNQLVNMNNGLSTLQFQSLSASVQRPQNLLQGGTQDNGTFQYNGSRIVWPQAIYGDGGQSGFNVANDALRFNTFTGQANDANFRHVRQRQLHVVEAECGHRGLLGECVECGAAVAYRAHGGPTCRRTRSRSKASAAS